MNHDAIIAGVSTGLALVSCFSREDWAARLRGRSFACLGLGAVFSYVLVTVTGSMVRPLFADPFSPAEATRFLLGSALVFIAWYYTWRAALVLVEWIYGRSA
ncbi:hypothetical protein M3A49_41480 [Paraburkholderia sp. CNPSo 3076]|uniref:hypothetical protein n=1 Tax=Paraburkholderia sp. CNPSo 3076 TaxID=2940936 RepID=UPI00224DE059|nr:hypothetical protein [Paraburkholderia sp. CNPSo 3076]MCX5545798.1 hypothetical protein [Paraburkholderia sp. CNPSo 3076]